MEIKGGDDRRAGEGAEGRISVDEVAMDGKVDVKLGIEGNGGGYEAQGLEHDRLDTLEEGDEWRGGNQRGGGER